MSNDVFTIDFETRSAADIRLGSYRYAEDPSTEVMCLAILGFDPAAEPALWNPAYPSLGIEEQGQNALDELFNHILSGGLVEAHNAAFERAVWENVCVARMGWPAVSPQQWRCSAAAAASFSLPRSLKGASEALLGDSRKEAKDMHGHKIMMKVSKPGPP